MRIEGGIILSHRERVVAAEPGEGLRQRDTFAGRHTASPHRSPSATPSPHGRRGVL
jgi:hypothetical protein